MMNKLQAIGEQLLPTIAYGDAAGLPFEKSKPHQAGSIHGLYDTETNPFLGKYPAGTWSDDTHLSLATALSLVRSDGFNLRDQAKAHVTALQHVEGSEADQDWVPPIVTKERQSGWGKSTTDSVRRIQSGVSPLESGEPNGAGNGVLMKMAPLVYWQAVRGTSLTKSQEQIIDFTRMTHAAPEAAVSSLVHRAVLATLLDPNFEVTPSRLSRLYQQSITWARLYEGEAEAEPHATSNILGRLEQFTYPGTPKPLQPGRIVDAAEKHGFYAPETLLMAYGSFMIESTYPDSVYRAVELGGDSDSIASIVATMSLFAHGNVQQPEDCQKLFAFERLERISKNLAQTALKGV